jgi:UDP-galactopyranose mutase
MPADGYVAMFERMLNHPNIKVILNTDHRDVLGQVGQARTVFTGPIDEYFDNRYGALPYRSLEFRHETSAVEYAQPVAVVNYPDAEGFTRILEHKHLTGHVGATTVLTTEWPQDHVVGVNDPYYPIPREENRSLHARYLELAADTDPGVVFAGRLADYKYYNMDQAVSRALLVFRGLVPGTRRPHMSETSP